jgi:hypothetical protein
VKTKAVENETDIKIIAVRVRLVQGKFSSRSQIHLGRLHRPHFYFVGHQEIEKVIVLAANSKNSGPWSQYSKVQQTLDLVFWLHRSRNMNILQKSYVGDWEWFRIWFQDFGTEKNPAVQALVQRAARDLETVRDTVAATQRATMLSYTGLTATASISPILIGTGSC